MKEEIFEIGKFINEIVAMHRRDQVAKHLNTQLNKYGEQNEYKLNFPTTKDLLHCLGRIWKRKLIKQHEILYQLIKKI